MGICVSSKERRVNNSQGTQPSSTYHGKAWFDQSSDQMKFWDSDTETWIGEASLNSNVIDADA